MAITPDGPRGPAKKIKNGVAVLALRTMADVFLFAIKYGSFWTLNTRDKFRIPKPFSRVDIDYRKVSYGDIQHLPLKKINLLFERELGSM